MKKSYLLAYSDSLGTRDEIKECLSGLDVIDTWRFDMPYTFYVISDNSANEISQAIRDSLGNGRFIITEISSENKQGWLPKETWYLINNKKRKPN